MRMQISTLNRIKRPARREHLCAEAAKIDSRGGAARWRRCRGESGQQMHEPHSLLVRRKGAKRNGDGRRVCGTKRRNEDKLAPLELGGGRCRALPSLPVLTSCEPHDASLDYRPGFSHDQVAQQSEVEKRVSSIIARIRPVTGTTGKLVL
jgi:hypothetical protein